jgi:uncharacterized membrane protein YphA (DoxX/SURF4 family)
VKRLTRIGRLFYALAMAGVGFQLFFYGDFPSMILPPVHSGIPWLRFWAYLAGALLFLASFFIVVEKKGRVVSLLLGGILLAICCFYYIPYELAFDPYYKNLGEWGGAEKELALSGGALVIAGTFPKKNIGSKTMGRLIHFLERLISFGGLFFSITMISFGIDHLLYTKPISTLVPNWIPNPIFWTYFAAIALIGSGLCIVFRFQLRVVASLLGIMIFLWFIVLHIPRAIGSPFAEMGNEVTSAFSALAFSGIALVIASSDQLKKSVSP